MSFKMIYWRHWRLVWAQMRSFRDPERLLDALLEVLRGSCGAGAGQAGQAGRPRAEDMSPVKGLMMGLGPYNYRQQTADSTQETIGQYLQD